MRSRISPAILAKSVFDFVCALLSLIVLAPLLALIALAIKVASPGPVLYRGVRVGRRGKTFRMLKFRTMVVDAEKQGSSVTPERDPRVTGIVGRFLRKHKLDELPQLLNVLRGEMSMVGPRPDFQKYADMYSDEERVILELLPGITDWATIWNTNQAAILEGSPDPEKSYEELIRPTKIALQLVYVRRHSLAVNLKILFCTAIKLCWQDWLPRELQPLGKPMRYWRLELEALLERLQTVISTQC